MPSVEDPNTGFVLNPQGTRHLSFDQRDGTWWRVVAAPPCRTPPLGADRAMMLRLSDIDLIIRISATWMVRRPDHQRTGALTDELARGAKALVLHYAGAR